MGSSGEFLRLSMIPQEYCQDKAGGIGSGFYYSSMFLDQPRRDALTALYAFREEVHNISRGHGDPQMAGMQLAWWRQELGNTFEDRPHHPISKMLHSAIQNYRLPQWKLLDIVAGVEQDLARPHYSTFDELCLYCQEITATTVLLSVPILGGNTPGVEKSLSDLGKALHLVEILRDIGEDARHNRVYLPLEDLAQFRVNTNDILQVLHTENFYALMEFETTRVRALLEQVLRSLPQPDRWQQLPHLIAAEIYLALLQEMYNDGYRVLRHKVALTPLRKAWIAWRTSRREKRDYKRWKKKTDA